MRLDRILARSAASSARVTGTVASACSGHGFKHSAAIGESLAALLGGSSTGWALAIGATVALVFSTLVQMLFGELLPKNYAIARADGSARALARSTRLYLAVFGPLIWVFDRASELFLRVLGIQAVHDVAHSATRDDLEHVIARSREEGQLTAELSTVLDRIVDFPRQDVEHAMIPRVRVDALAVTDSISSVRTQMAAGHTRYPILDDDSRIVGVIHLVDLLRYPPDSAWPVLRLSGGTPVGNVEQAVGGPRSVVVGGWALDPDTAAPVDVHVYVDGVGRANIKADRRRTDVGAAHGLGELHGFDLTLDVGTGRHEVCVYAINVGAGGNVALGCRTVELGRPFGTVEMVRPQPGAVRVAGWALDPDTTAPCDVHIWICLLYTSDAADE